MESPPEPCPECGSFDSFRTQFSTGGGWRVAAFICEECGFQFDPYLRE